MLKEAYEMGKTVQETRKLWEDRIDRWEKSGQSVQEFIKSEGVSDASFYQWRKRLKNKKKRKPEKPAPSFLQLTPENKQAITSQSSMHHYFQPFVETTCFDVVIDFRHRVRVPTDFNSDALVRLLNVLEVVK